MPLSSAQYQHAHVSSCMFVSSTQLFLNCFSILDKLNMMNIVPDSRKKKLSLVMSV